MIGIENVVILSIGHEGTNLVRFNEDKDPNNEEEEDLNTYPMRGIANVAMEKRKTLFINDPFSYIEYD